MVINDLPVYTNNLSADLYTDDTTFYMIGETRDYMEQHLHSQCTCVVTLDESNISSCFILLQYVNVFCQIVQTSGRKIYIYNFCL